jgi:hypothetical protein
MRQAGKDDTQEAAAIGKLFEHLAGRDKTWRTMTLMDIDDLLIQCAHRYARPTVADIASSIRCFSRFLLATGRSRSS